MLSALVDCGCTDSIISLDAVQMLKLERSPMEQTVDMIGNLSTKCVAQCVAELMVGSRVICLEFMVNQALVAGCDVLLGNDAISLLGGG